MNKSNLRRVVREVVNSMMRKREVRGTQCSVDATFVTRKNGKKVFELAVRSSFGFGSSVEIAGSPTGADDGTWAINAVVGMAQGDLVPSESAFKKSLEFAGASNVSYVAIQSDYEPSVVPDEEVEYPGDYSGIETPYR